MSEPELTGSELEQLRGAIAKLGRERVAERLHIADGTLANVASGGRSRGVTRYVIRSLLPEIVREANDAPSNGSGEKTHGTVPPS